MDCDRPRGIEGRFVHNFISGHGALDLSVCSSPAQLPGTEKHKINKDYNDETDGDRDCGGLHFNYLFENQITMKDESYTNTNIYTPRSHPSTGKCFPPPPGG